MSRIFNSVLVLSFFFLSGCSSFLNVGHWFSNFRENKTLKTISLVSDTDANEGYPVALDVVFVSDKKVLDTLNQLRSAEWFSGKSDYIRNNPKLLTVLSWEIVPGQGFYNVDVSAPLLPAIGVFIFANFDGPRSYRMLIQNEKSVSIRLRRNDYELALD